MASRSLTQGSIVGNIISFSVPYLISYFLQLLYGLADLFIIGLYGDVASTTAVAIGSQIMHMVTVIIVGFAMGSTVMVARAVGARNGSKAASIVGNTTTLFLGMSIVLAALLLALLKPIVNVMSTPAEAVMGTSRYLAICFAGIPAITAYNVIASIYRGSGDSTSPMYFVAIACFFNILLDYVFIGMMHMGPEGAAWATIISQAISVVVSLVFLRKKGLGFTMTGRDLRPRTHILSSILNIGTPVALQDGFIQVAFLVITIIANRRGLNDAAAVGIVEKIISMLFLVPSAMLATISTITAQCIGAKDKPRGKKTFHIALAITVGYGLLVGLSMQVLAEPTVGLFTSSDVVARLGGEYLRSYSFDALLAGTHFCFSGYFIAYGYSIVSFIHNFASAFLVRIPFSYILSVNYPDTLFPMGCAAPLGSIFSIVICLGFYIAFKKKGKIS